MSSGFVSETELAEARKKRQEEWEKVRRPDDPEGISIFFLPQSCLILYFGALREARRALRRKVTI